MGNPVMIDWSMLERTGISKLFKLYNASKPDSKVDLKEQMRLIMRVVDEEDAIARYVLNNIPPECKMISDEVERLIYLTGNICLFHFNNEYNFLPFAGEDIDKLGRFTIITPIPIATENTNYEEQKKLLSSLKLKVFYTVPTDKEIADAGGEDKIAVIIRDYPNQINNQYVIPRVMMNEALLDLEAEIFPMSRTARMLATGIKGMIVPTADASKKVDDANNALEEAALTGSAFLPILGNPQMKDIQNGNVAKNEEFMQSLQTLENFRLSTYGISNGGLFQKKAHVLEGEEEMNGGPVNGRLERGLTIRKNAADIANKVWGLNLSWEINKTASPEKFYSEEMNIFDKDLNISKEVDTNGNK